MASKGKLAYHSLAQEDFFGSYLIWGKCAPLSRTNFKSARFIFSVHGSLLSHFSSPFCFFGRPISIRRYREKCFKVFDFSKFKCLCATFHVIFIYRESQKNAYKKTLGLISRWKPQPWNRLLLYKSVCVAVLRLGFHGMRTVKSRPSGFCLRWFLFHA